MNGQIRQGDVLLIPVDVKVPENAEIKQTVVLAEGETPGHFHELKAPEVAVWGEFVCVLGDGDGSLTHPEHDPVPAFVVRPCQTYQIVHQKEYTLDGMWTPVLD